MRHTAEPEEGHLERRATQRKADAPRVNFGRLDLASLLRYRRLHELPVAASATKEQLVEAVQVHFRGQVRLSYFSCILCTTRRLQTTAAEPQQSAVKMGSYSGW